MMCDGYVRSYCWVTEAVVAAQQSLLWDIDQNVWGFDPPALFNHYCRPLSMSLNPFCSNGRSCIMADPVC